MSTDAGSGVGTETLPYPTTPQSLFEVLGIRMLYIHDTTETHTIHMHIQRFKNVI